MSAQFGVLILQQLVDRLGLSFFKPSKVATACSRAAGYWLLVAICFELLDA